MSLSSNMIMGYTDQQSTVDKLNKRNWNWLEYMLCRNDDSIAKQAVQ